MPLAAGWKTTLVLQLWYDLGYFQHRRPLPRLREAMARHAMYS